MRDLDTLGGPDAIGDSGCRGNEHKGLVAGSSYTNSTPNPSTGIPTMDPFLLENGRMTDLGTLGGVFGGAQCVNNRGQVIGTSSLAENPGACFTGEPGCHPFLWDHGVLRDLGTLGGDNGATFWLNNAGEVVGQADLPGSQIHHAFLWRRGIMTDLGTLGGNSSAAAINSKGQIVGNSELGAPTSNLPHAFLWENGEPMIDLNTLIPANSSLLLVTAFNINDRGEIVGWGAPPGVQDLGFGGRLFVLIPCDKNHADNECEDEGTAVARGETSQRPNVVLPENVRRMLRQRLGSRYHIRGLETPKN
jgi:probable HAF family extracellular repeat protein